MAVGNRKKMIDINTNYVLEHCRAWCKEKGITIGVLGEKLGHSQCYIQSSCRAGKMPPAELNLLYMFTGMDMDKATNIEEVDAVDAELTSEEKLDYIIEMLESLTKGD